MTKDRNSYYHWKVSYNMGLLVLNLILLGVNVGLMLRNPSHEQGVSAIGVIVAALAILVTLLIGWNIFSVVDFKSHLEEVERSQSVIEELKKEFSMQKDDIQNLKEELEQKINKVDEYANRLGGMLCAQDSSSHLDNGQGDRNPRSKIHL